MFWIRLRKLQTGGPLQMDIYDSKVLLDWFVHDFEEKYPLISLQPNASIISRSRFWEWGSQNTRRVDKQSWEKSLCSFVERWCARFYQDYCRLVNRRNVHVLKSPSTDLRITWLHRAIYSQTKLIISASAWILGLLICCSW